MNLYTEYRKRNNDSSICLVEEGVCFFEKDNKPALVATISSHSKSAMTCQYCIDRSTLIVELYDVKNFAAAAYDDVVKGFNVPASHNHFGANNELRSILHICGYSNYEPYVSGGKREQEAWLWNFFLATKPLNSQYYRSMINECREPNLQLRTIEQMLWVAQRKPSVFSFYYKRIYSKFLIGRKYILN